MEHVYTCKRFNNEQIDVSYKQLFNGNISEQMIVLNKIQKRFDEIEKQIKNKNDISYLTGCSP